MSHKSYLTLCNDLARECGVTGNASSISAVTSQTGEAARLVDWIRQAHNDIQNRYEVWRWMRHAFTVNTTSGDDTYASTDCTDTTVSPAAAISRFARWWPQDEQGNQNLKIYLTSAGVGTQTWLTFLPWSYFTSIYRLGSHSNTFPAHFTVDPQNNLVLGPPPDGIYTITGEFQLSSKDFSANSDTAEFPQRFDDLIVYEAMKKYGGYHSAAEVYQRGVIEGGKLMRQLERDQLPRITFGPPLA